MRKWKFISVFVLLALLLGAGITVAVGQASGSAQDAQESEGFALRAKTVNAALTQNALFDCAIYQPGSDTVLPVEQQVFQIAQDVKITPDDGREYLGAVWSPDGTAMVFVAPTDEQRNIQDDDALLSDEETRLVAVSKNELVLYFPERDDWEPITSDGARPVWTADGQDIYYMAGTDLMRFNRGTRASVRTGLSAPRTGVGLLFSQSLSDGRLLAPRQSHAPIEVQGGATPTALGQIGVAESDHILLSPQGAQAIVAYGANTWKGQFVPAITVLHQSDGRVTPIMKNCQYSAIEMIWSPDGSQIAYPVHAERSEIRIYDVTSGQARILVRLDSTDLLSGLSWSPDGKYLAFTQGDDRSTPRSIWAVSTDGAVRQRLVEGGLLPNWSPDGQHILYARPGSGRLLDWHLLEVQPTANVEGE